MNQKYSQGTCPLLISCPDPLIAGQRRRTLPKLENVAAALRLCVGKRRKTGEIGGIRTFSHTIALNSGPKRDKCVGKRQKTAKIGQNRTFSHTLTSKTGPKRDKCVGKRRKTSEIGGICTFSHTLAAAEKRGGGFGGWSARSGGLMAGIGGGFGGLMAGVGGGFGEMEHGAAEDLEGGLREAADLAPAAGGTQRSSVRG